MLSPLRGPVPTSTRRRTSSGATRVSSCATKPPREKPSKSTWLRPSALMKASALAAILSTEVGTSSELLEMPALSNRMTSRSLAKPSVTSGSQWSMVPVKCMLKTSGSARAMPVSADSLAAVDGDNLAGNERGRGGSEKDDRAGNFVGLAHPTQRNGRHQRRLVLGVAGEAIEHAGVGRPGCDGVDAHTRGSALERRGFGDAFDGVLAADIDRGTGGTLMTVGRGDVDDAAALLRRHHAQLMFQAEQHAEHIGVEGGGVALGGLIDDQARLALGTGIVDGGIDPAEAGHGLIDQVAHLVFVTDVGLDERGFGAQAAKFGLESLAFGLPAAGDDEAGAVLGEGDGGGATYACEGSSDQNDWLFHGVAP